MITLQAIRIDQSLDLTASLPGSKQFLVLLLPNGEEIRAELPQKDMNKFLLFIGQEPEEAPKRTPRPPDPEPEPAPPAPSLTEEEQAAADTPIPWNELNDDVLSPVMKAAFFKLKAPMLMSPNAIMTLVEEITNKFSPSDWSDVMGPSMAQAPVVSAPEPPLPAPVRQPRVQWADGTPMMPGSVTGRSVPKDEMGYPVVEGEVDPGEVVSRGSDVDEDGVGQL